MGFEPLGKTVKSLLSDHIKFNIPRFQRDFSWDEQNYEEFYNDIINQIDFSGEDFKANKYFLGNMIFLGDKNSDSVEVIDGQQRLTTITIFLAAIRNTLLSVKEEKAKSIADTIQNEYILKKIDGEVYRKLEPTSSFPYFANTIQDESSVNQEPSSDEEEDIKSTFDKFLSGLTYDSMKKEFETKLSLTIDMNNYIELLRVVRDQILACEVVSIYVDDLRQANKIFENINSKGKPLSQVDLIKNHIFSAVPISEIGIDNVQNEWNAMKQKLSSSGQNSNFSISFDDFFLDYIKAKYPQIKFSNKNAYEKFRKNFDVTEKIEKFMREIIVEIDLYIRVINPKEGDFARQEKKPIFYALQAINRFKGKQVRIPILAIFIKRKENRTWIKNDKLVDFMQFLANFHFAVFGTNMKFRSNQLTKPFTDFSININNSNTREEIASAINTLKTDLLQLLGKDSFIEYFCGLTFHKETSRRNQTEFPAVFALNAIENKMNDSLINHTTSSIEHILDESESEQRNIGNLVVLEQELNSKINSRKQKINRALSYKEKKEYYNESQFQMVQQVLVEYGDETFGTTDIEMRAKQLAIYFYDNFLDNL